MRLSTAMRPKSSLVVPYFSMWARAAIAISCDGAMTPAATLNCMSHGSRTAAAAAEPFSRTPDRPLSAR